jgi:hypothetical protein
MSITFAQTGGHDVRFWHKADIACALHMSAFEGKADIKVGLRRGELN